MKCSGCSNAITSKDHLQITSNNEVMYWHRSCFKCFKCGELTSRLQYLRDHLFCEMHLHEDYDMLSPRGDPEPSETVVEPEPKPKEPEPEPKLTEPEPEPKPKEPEPPKQEEPATELPKPIIPEEKPPKMEVPQLDIIYSPKRAQAIPLCEKCFKPIGIR